MSGMGKINKNEAREAWSKVPQNGIYRTETLNDFLETLQVLGPGF